MGVLVALAFTAAPALAQGELLGYWTFDGDTLDRSGYGRDLEPAGPPTYAPGPFGSALELDGAQFAVRPVDDAALDFGAGDFTIQVRVRFDTLSGERVLIEKFTGAGGPGWTLTKLDRTQPDRAQLIFYAAPTVVLSSDPLLITTGEWHHVAVRRSGPSFEMYYDGGLVAAASSADPIPDSPAPLLLGRRGTGVFHLVGGLDEVALWSCALPETSFARSAPTELPAAHAGADQSVDEGALVTLDGGGSGLGAPCGTPGFVWTQIAGTPVVLDVTDPVRPTFTAPPVSQGGETLRFQLVVGAGAYASAPDVVDVVVNDVASGCPHSGLGDIVGVDAFGNPTVFPTLQAAIDDPYQVEVLVFGGAYAERPLIDGKVNWTLRVCGQASVLGLVVKRSYDVRVVGLEVGAGGVFLAGGPNGAYANAGVTLSQCQISGAQTGLRMDPGQSGVVVVDCAIVGCGNAFRSWDYWTGVVGGDVEFLRCVLSRNMWDAAVLYPDVTARFEECTFEGNGKAAIALGPRAPGAGTPTLVTLLRNTFVGNHNAVQPGISTVHLRNYDQMLDASDDQASF